MKKLLESYRALHDQGFVPIFVDDPLDSRMLVAACISAGFSTIEYTLRRRDAHVMIPWIRSHYPDLHVLVGSTLDSDTIIHSARKRGFRQLLTLDELSALGVDGFVSMHGFSESTILRFSQSHLIIPTAFTITEAMRQFDAGAHFIKLLGPELDLLRLSRSAGTYGYCPVMITGGMTLERITEAVRAGAVLVGSGFDLMLRRHDPNTVSQKQITDILKQYSQMMRQAVDATFPELAKARGTDVQTWLNSLPHQHHFANLNELS